MKKFYFLLLSFLVLSGMTAAAKSLTVEWNNAGSIEIHAGSISSAAIELPDGATSYTFAEAPSYIAILPVDGYSLVSGKNNSTAANKQNVAVQNNATYGQIMTYSYYTSTLDTMGDKPTLTVETTKVERNETFTVDVVNGARCINAVFSNLLRYTPKLTNGANTVAFNPEYDTELNLYLIAGQGASTIYKVELNGKAIAYNKIYQRWQCGAIKAGDKLTIQVFEGEEPAVEEVALTIDAPEGCISSIRNRTLSTFIDLPADGKLLVTKDTDLQFNINSGDFDITKITLGANDITKSYSSEYGYFRFTATEDATLAIEAEGIVYEDIEFTGYIMNPEGVRLNLGFYETDNKADLSAGEAIDSDISLITKVPVEGGTVDTENIFTADATKEYKIKVSSRNPYIYVQPLEGYYIKTVIGFEEGAFCVVNSVRYDASQPKSTTFYIIAEKLVNDAKLDVNLLGSNAVRLVPSTLYSKNWGNPEISYDLKQGMQTIEFNELYSAPFTCGAKSSFKNLEIFYNGLSISPADDGSYAVPYVKPADADKVPVLTFNNTGRMTIPARLEVSGDEAAALTYGPIDTPAKAPLALLGGTKITVKSSYEYSSAKLNGEPLEQKDGIYVFDLATGANTLVITKEDAGVANIADAAAALSYDGATVSAPGADIEIFAITGACVAKAHASFDATRLPAGIYVVRAAGRTLKIVRR